MATALITGIGGQDGTYLAERLLSSGWAVVGIDSGAGVGNRLAQIGIGDDVRLIQADICDAADMRRAIEDTGPSTIYHLAAKSFVPDSWRDPVTTARFGVLPTAAMLDAVLAVDSSIHLVQASSSEVFGRPIECPQHEGSPVQPVSPYGAGKAHCLAMGRMYREQFDIRVSSAILYNHESPRRPPHFVTRKITQAAAMVSRGLMSELRLGNLDVQRDWSFAGDIVDGLVLIAGRERGDDFILASGTLHSVRDLLDAAFGHVGLDWNDYVVVDPQFIRPREGYGLCGDSSKAKTMLGWKPKVDFTKLVEMMVAADLQEL